MDRFQSMRIFSRVAEMSSFTKAATSLSLPKASVSARIQALESELGTQLFHRTTRTVQLTHDGQVFYERCKDLLADVDDLTTLFQKDSRALTGRIRVDMPSRMARLRVIPRLPEFFAEHPGIQIELGCTDREVNLVEEGYDCVVRIGELEDSGLIAKRVGAFKIVHCVSPSYVKKFGKPKSLDDLAEHYLVHYVGSFGEKPEGFEYWDGEKFREIPMKGMVTVNNAEAYTAACLAGLGIIQVPNTTFDEYLKSGALIEVLPKVKADAMPISIVYPSRRNLSRRVKVFMDWLETILGD